MMDELESAGENTSPIKSSSRLKFSLANLPNSLVLLLCLVAGLLIPLSLSPFNIWPLGVIALITFFLLIHNTNCKTLFWRAWLFGLGTYGLGVSWVYVSIHGFGGASIPLAAFLVAVFVCGLGLVFALPFLIFHRLLQTNNFTYVLVFATLWLFDEWLRTWLLTGLPWLFVGYAHLHTFFSGFAPLFSVLGISFFVALVSALIGLTLENRFNGQATKKIEWISAGAIVTILLCGFLLSKIEWTKTSSESIGVAILQPNIDQDDKWQEENLEPTLKLLREESNRLWNQSLTNNPSLSNNPPLNNSPLEKNQLIVWPESAVPLPYNQAIPFLNQINREAADHQAGIITGIIYDDSYQNKYFNSVVGFGDAIGIYHKRRLVPFGEYVPLEHWLRGLIEFFNLPTSIISFGDEQQPHLKFNDLYISPSVCYEVVYPELVAQSARDANVLLSVSNLGWFRDSLGRHQFMQMGRMRALETQRYHIYSTNNGPSAVFNQKGNSVAETKAFIQTTLESQIYSVSGETPYMVWGNWPIIIFCFTFLAMAFRLSFATQKSEQNKKL